MNARSDHSGNDENEAGRVELALYNVKATGHVASLRKKLGLPA